MTMGTREAILSRRTIKEFTGERLSRETLEALLELAVWAPNHRMTEPWRFTVVCGEKLNDFAEVVVGAIRDDDAPKLLAKRPQLVERLPKLGAFICVHRTPVPEDPMLDREDYAACACAVQNLLLAATAQGIGSFWSTGRIFERPPVRAFLEVDPGADVVGSLWLGVPVREGQSRRTPAGEKTAWIV